MDKGCPARKTIVTSTQLGIETSGMEFKQMKAVNSLSHPS